MSEAFDVKILSTKPVGEVYDKLHGYAKPFLSVYFPEEILNKLGWDINTKIMAVVEKGTMTIIKNEDDQELLYTNELTYTTDEE